MSRSHRAIPPEKADRILEMLAAGATHAEIMAEVNVSSGTISNVKKRNEARLAELQGDPEDGVSELREGAQTAAAVLAAAIIEATERAGKLKDVNETAGVLKSVAPAAKALSELVKSLGVAPKRGPAAARSAAGDGEPEAKVAIPPAQFRIV